MMRDFPGCPAADCVLPMQGAQVQSLPRELDPSCHNEDQRSCKLQLRPSIAE